MENKECWNVVLGPEEEKKCSEQECQIYFGPGATCSSDRTQEAEHNNKRTKKQLSNNQ